MATLILIDQSLRTLGGHHYAYAWNLLEAAERAGYQPVLATHRDFAEPGAFPAHWRVHALFRHESYSRYTLDIQALAGDATRRPQGWWQRLRDRFAARARAKHVAAYAEDCAALFARERVGAGDLVFCATTSELDLGGLARYLATRTPTAGLAWHAQFHFGLFGGRDPGYAAQRAGTSALRAVFAAARAGATGHALHFHCTTPQLATQYSQLAVGHFGALPYPVHERFSPRAEPVAPGVVRIACLGHSRREKGYDALPLILRSLWRDWFGTGRARLVLQTHRGKQRRALEALVRELGNAGALEFAPFPLPLEGYTELVRGADLGLLLYDPTRYYARCSGVLLEMQCAGVPVLVPAGSWLAGQVEPLNQPWLDSLAARMGALQPASGDASFAVPAGTRSALLAFDWEQPVAPGRYLEVELQDEAGTVLGRRILGARADRAPVLVLFALAPSDAARSGLPCTLRVALRAAWQSPGTAPPGRFTGWRSAGDRLPAGLVGLTLSDASQLASSVEELLHHHAHYRDGARSQAAACGHRQAASQVLAGLLAAH
jgi:hypothetical protein